MTSSPSWFATRRAKLLCCLALFLLGMVRWWPDLAPEARFPVHPEITRLAISWASTGTLSDPFLPGKSGPSTHTPPVYPVFMGVILKVFGNGWTGFFVLFLCAGAFMAAQAALLPVVAMRVGLAFEAGVLAAVAWILAKGRLWPEHEAALGGLLILLLTIVLSLWVESKGSRVMPILAGALCALTALTASAAIIVVAVWFLTPLAAPLWRQRRLEIALFVLAGSALIAPWTIRNYQVFREFILIRGNFGTELAVSNNACSDVAFVENVINDCFRAQHPNESAAELKRLVSLGEPEYNRQRTREAFDWIKDNPLRFASLTVRRFVRFWIPSETGNPIAEVMHPLVTRDRLWVYAMTLMSIFGLIRLWRASPHGAMFISLWLFLFPLVYYIVQFIERYRRPVLWITFLLAGSEILRVIQEQRRRPKPKKSAPGAS